METITLTGRKIMKFLFWDHKRGPMESNGTNGTNGIHETNGINDTNGIQCVNGTIGKWEVIHLG